MTATRVYTIEDLEDLPDDGHVWELIAGELRRREPVGGRQGAIGATALCRVGNFVEDAGLGEVFAAGTIFVLQRSPDTGLKPDVAFVRDVRVPVGDAFEKPLEVVPDLVVEVDNPNAEGELAEKIELYRRHGAPLLWVLWPRRRGVTVYEIGEPAVDLKEDDDLDGGDVLPGFRVAVADLFRVGR